jgi:ligand-binding sensor domain-containing protein
MLLLASLPVRAQQLSVRRYDVSDGIAHGDVSAIHQDRKGYLWFGTWEGLSRFDGYRFTNYGVPDGLGHPIINDIAEDRRGRLWIATNGFGGVYLLIDDPQEAASSLRTGPALAERRRFISFRVGDSRESNCISAMLFDQADNLWVSTDDGVYRAAPSTDGRLQFNLIARTGQTDFVGVALADRRGRFWFGVINELIQIDRDQIKRYGPEDGVGRRPIRSVVEDRQGRVLAANEREVFEFIEPPTGNMDGNVDGDARGSWRRLPLSLRPGQLIWAMLSDSSGALWIGTSTGLIKYGNGKQTLYTDAQGLSGSLIRTLMEDRDGNLWIGTRKRGVCKLSGELIVSFTKTEGLPGQALFGVVEGRQGGIYAGIENDVLVKIVEGRAAPIPGARLARFASIPFQDSRGDWWTHTSEGLFRSEGPELQFRRGRKVGRVDGITVGPISLVTEDTFGKLWVLTNDAFYWLDTVRDHIRAIYDKLHVHSKSEAVSKALRNRLIY